MLAIPSWICLDCKKVFIPIIKESNVSFNCPSCGSPKTIAKRLSVSNLEPDSNSLNVGSAK